jgi:hypothetical protein
MRSNKKVLGPKSKQADKLGQTLLLAKQLWRGYSSSAHDEQLKLLVGEHGLSLAAGDLLLIDGKLYVSHAGLLRLAKRKRCTGIQTEAIPEFCDPQHSRWVVKATVFKSATSKGFVGYGDADPSNVSALVRGAEMRVAETRAVNRALRKAYGIGLCSAEEIGSFSGPIEAKNGIASKLQKRSRNNGDLPGNGQPLLRDRLCLLIRQHNLAAAQVRRYAAEFCHVESLRDASRDQIEEFINHLTNLAAQGNNALLEQLEPHAEKGAQPTEAA